MRKAYILVVALLLQGSSAFAGAGIDLSVVGCPGNAGAVGGDAGPVDCSGASDIVILGTWSPFESYSDLVALDTILDAQVYGDLDVNGFWNWDPFGCNHAALSSSHVRPATVCSSPLYTALWVPGGSQSFIAASRNSPYTERIGVSVSRPTVTSVTAQQLLFGFQIIVDTATAVEAGGHCAGCGVPFTIVWTSARPGTLSGFPTELHSSTGNYPGFSNVMTFNNFATPTKSRTWGQLKSLYR